MFSHSNRLTEFSNGHCDLIPLQIFFILISVNTKDLLILHTKFQPNILFHSGEKVDFNGFAIFSIRGHVPSWILDQVAFYRSEVLQSDHAACGI